MCFWCEPLCQLVFKNSHKGEIVKINVDQLIRDNLLFKPGQRVFFLSKLKLSFLNPFCTILKTNLRSDIHYENFCRVKKETNY